MLSEYLTVKGTAIHEIIIDKSRFIAHISRTETEEEAQAFIASIKKLHKDATHNCSAYLIGERDQIQKALDDGEPSGTAGVPILEVIRKKGLKDTTVVVTRYFGGIKLGAGGLIRAYSRSASEGINTAGIVERTLMKVLNVQIEYHWLGKLENELRASTYLIKDIQYLEKVSILTYVKEDLVEPFSNWITELTNGQAELSETDTQYLEQSKA